MRLTPYPNNRYTAHLQSLYPKFHQAILECVIQRKSFAKGSTILAQGQEVDQLFLVNEGRVSINTAAINGRRFQLGEVHCDNHLFGEIEFFTGDQCQWNVVADIPLEAEVIDAAKLQQRLLDQPELSLFFASALALDYQESLEIYTSRLLHPIAYNIAFDLWQRHHSPGNLDGFLKIEQEAERFGTSGRAYRRALKTLIDEGLVSKQGNRLHVNDWQRLEQFLALAEE